MLTGTAEAVLLALSTMTDEQRHGLKLVILASAAQVHKQSAKIAIKTLRTTGLIETFRRCQTGPDAVYTFILTPHGQFTANALKVGRDSSGLS